MGDCSEACDYLSDAALDATLLYLSSQQGQRRLIRLGQLARTSVPQVSAAAQLAKSCQPQHCWSPALWGDGGCAFAGSSVLAEGEVALMEKICGSCSRPVHSCDVDVSRACNVCTVSANAHAAVL